MRGAGEVTDQLAVAKRWIDESKVVQMPGAFPRIVGNVRIPLVNIIAADVSDEVPDRLGHRIDVTGRAGNCLRYHVALMVEHTGRQVAGLAHRGRKSRSQQRQGLFFDH